MRTLRQAVDEFLKALELTEKQRVEAQTQHDTLRTKLQQELALDPAYQTFLTGSYKRSTAIRPLKDIDLFCVLQRSGPVDPERMRPSDALTLVKEALERVYPGKVADPQNRSVNIEFSGSGIGYDVVPAFDASAGAEELFLIPDLSAGEWIQSNPRVHERRSTEANERAGKLLKPLTKAVKHWNRRQPKANQLRSFHVEVMAWDVLTQKPADRVTGLRDLFAGLATRVARVTPDPAGLGPDLDADLTRTERDAAARRFRDAADAVTRALDYAADGRLGPAHDALWGLFAQPYPERGKAEPGPGGPAIVGGGTDGSSSRFG